MGLVESQIIKPRKNKWLYEGVDTRNYYFGWNASNETTTLDSCIQRRRMNDRN